MLSVEVGHTNPKDLVNDLRDRVYVGRILRPTAPASDLIGVIVGGNKPERSASLFLLFPFDPDQESGTLWDDPDGEAEDEGTSSVPLPRKISEDQWVSLTVRIELSPSQWSIMQSGGCLTASQSGSGLYLAMDVQCCPFNFRKH